MPFCNAVTINEDEEAKETILEIVWKSFDYFPKGVWESVEYVGNINIEHDLKIRLSEKVYGAFIFDHLVRKIKVMKALLEDANLLLALTHDPVVSIYHRFELARLKRIMNLIHDYVSEDVGIVSFFKLRDKDMAKVTAHGLGHNQGLRHHLRPIDLMYVRLLTGSLIKQEGFCTKCQRKLKNEIDSIYIT